MTRRRGWSLTAVAAALLLVVPAGDGLAKRSKTKSFAIVNGKRLKSGRGAYGQYATTGFSIGIPSKPKRGVVRTVTATCAGDVKAMPLPATFADCFSSYTVAGKRGAFQQWVGNGLDVTVDSVDGGRIQGTFAGSIPGDPPVTVEGGRFFMVLVDIGV